MINKYFFSLILILVVHTVEAMNGFQSPQEVSFLAETEHMRKLKVELAAVQTLRKEAIMQLGADMCNRDLVQDEVTKHNDSIEVKNGVDKAALIANKQRADKAIEKIQAELAQLAMREASIVYAINRSKH